MATCGREQKKADWVEGEAEQQCSPKKGLSHRTDLSHIARSGLGLVLSS